MKDKLYNIKMLSKYLMVSRETVLKLIKEGELKAVKVGREWRVLESALNKYLRGEQ